MKKISLCFLLIFLGQSIVFAQNSRLKLSPYFGLGIKLPESQDVISGPYQMTQLYTYKNIGNYVDSQGKEVVSYTTTNRIGLNLGYDVTDNIELHVGANRLNLISSYSVPYDMDILGTPISSINGSYSFLSVSGGLKYKFNSKSWVTIDGQYTPDYLKKYRADLKKAEAGPAGNPYVNSAGSGLEFISNSVSPTLTSVYFGVGKKMIFDLHVELGLSLGLKPVGSYDIKYFQSNRLKGTSRITETASAIFLSVQQPINIPIKKRVKTPKPEKIETPKKEREKPKPKEKESYEFKDKVIFKGDDIVLDNIKFEQSKSVLLIPGMAELDDVFDLLEKYPDAKVALTGYTSQEGNRRDNIDLSEERGKACKAYLVKKGIKSSRIQAIGLGPDKPISTTNSELNRRVEIKVF
jgi:outer membrane protein OmpA-like peptidoglycan-associated protein